MPPRNIRRFADFTFNDVVQTGNVQSVTSNPIGPQRMNVPGKFANIPIPGRWADMQMTWNLYSLEGSNLPVRGGPITVEESFDLYSEGAAPQRAEVEIGGWVSLANYMDFTVDNNTPQPIVITFEVTSIDLTLNGVKSDDIDILADVYSQGDTAIYVAPTVGG